MPFKTMEDLDKPTMDNILECLALSPTVRDNGIARCSRRTNIMWRYKKRNIVKTMLRVSIDWARRDNGTVGCLLLVDLDDVL